MAETLPALVHSASLLPPGPRSLAGSAPVTIPGSLPRSPSLHSSSSLSTSPLSSLSQSLSGPLVSSAMTPPQQPPPLRSEPATLGSAASSYSSLGACLGVRGSLPTGSGSWSRFCPIQSWVIRIAGLFTLWFCLERHHPLQPV